MPNIRTVFYYAKAPTTWAIALLVVAATPSILHAQDSAILRGQPAESTASADEQMLAALQKARKDGEGLVIIGAGFDRLQCLGIDLVVARIVDGKAQPVRITAAGKFLGAYTDIEPKGLAAGEWMLAAVKCNARGSRTFNGPFAKFNVPAGGIVDAGFLKIDFQRPEFPKSLFTAGGTIRLSVTLTPEFRLAELRKRIPKVMSLVKKQPMVLTAPAEQDVKPRSPFSRRGSTDADA